MTEVSNPEASTQLLEQKYDLHKAPEVNEAAIRTESRTGNQVSQNPLDRIQNYLNRFREITEREDPQQRERGMEAIKRLLHRDNVIKPDEVPESYWENQRRIIRERGQGADLAHVDFEEVKRQNTEAIIADQRTSLDKWVDYLSSADAEAAYPDAAKYWALRGVLALSTYDKENKKFRSRKDDQGKTSPFPDLNREALAVAIDMVVKRVANKAEYAAIELRIRQTKNKIRALSGQLRGGDASVQKVLEVEEQQLATLHSQEDSLLGFGELLSPTKDETKVQKEARLNSRSRIYQQIEQANFAKVYAWAIEKATPTSAESLSNTQGAWIKYEQGSDHMPLATSLQGHGTGWCTAGESTAETQLQGGDFYVYYSNDSGGKPTVPRVAIRMEADTIAEIRGIAHEQNLDPYVAPIVEAKLEEFPDGKAYRKKVADMKHLTEIDRKTQSGALLDASDVAFLYEVDNPIQGFGYSRDPRIEELRNQRNLEEDMPIVFSCEPSQIAHTLEELRPDTRAYVGPLVSGIFNKLQRYDIEHIYTSFPERKIRRQKIEIGGKTKEELWGELIQAGIDVTPDAQAMIESSKFTTLPMPRTLNIAILKGRDLFAGTSKTPDHVYKAAQKLGLDLCPAEVGPLLLLQDTDNSMGEVNVLVQQMPDSDDSPAFYLGQDDYGDRWLDGWVPGHWMSFGDKFVFSFPKVDS